MFATGWTRRAALASLALAAFVQTQAHAQFVGGVVAPTGIAGRVGFPGAGPVLTTGGFVPVNPYAQAGAAAAVLSGNLNNPYVNPAFDGIAGTPAYVNPYMPYGGGFGWGMVDPVSGYLRGIADVTTAAAQAQVTLQRSRILNQEALRSQIDTRRRLIEEARWERMNTPGAEDIRIRDMEMALARSRRNPPRGEIWSGKALNDLLIHLIDQQSRGNKGPLVALDEEVLKKINVTDGTGGNVGMLKDGGKIPWVASLQGADFMDLRESLDTKLPAAVNSLKFGQPVEKGTLDDIKAALKKAHRDLDEIIGKLSPSDYLEAKRFLNQLDESVRALQNPNATNYFTGKWAAKATTVNDLVKQMAETGLRFAPATPGDEAAYNSLHYSLASYDANLPALIASQPMGPNPPMPPR